MRPKKKQLIQAKPHLDGLVISICCNVATTWAVVDGAKDTEASSNGTLTTRDTQDSRDTQGTQDTQDTQDTRAL